MAITNEHVYEAVDAYLHDLLAPAERVHVQRHCAECPACQAALAEAQRRLEALRALPSVRASAELIQRTEARLDEAAAARRLPRPWAWLRSRPLAQKIALGAAAAGLFIGILNIYYLRLAPSPYDLRVLGQTELLAGADASLRLIVFNQEAGASAAGVPVHVMLASKDPDRGVTLTHLETDHDGTGQPCFRLPDWEDGEYLLKIVADTPGGKQSVSRTVRLRRSWQVRLSTDRPVYQPGQTILMRSLALRRPDLRPVAGEKVVFSVTDPKGNKIFRYQGQTSRFGIASTECPLADEILEGTYRLECQVGGDTGRLAALVKRYVLPRLKVSVALGQSFYQPGEVISGKVQAAYFFGKPVAGAAVTIALKAGDDPAKPLAQIDARTDERGTAEFRLPVPDGLVKQGEEKDAPITLAVKVADAAGQEQSAQASCLVTTRPLRIEAIPEAGTLVKGVPNTVYLLTTQADGRPARTRLAVSWKEAKLRTDELGVAAIEITPTAGTIPLRVEARDEQGRTAQRDFVLPCGQAANDFLVRPDRAVYDGGDTMRLAVLGSGAEPVFLDFIKDGQTLWTATVDLKDGRGEASFDLPAELFGTIELWAYRYGTGAPLCRTRVLYVRQAGKLAIEANLDRKEYRPGQTASVTFRLADEKGQPTPGAISLAGVDEAVFAVLGQVPGGESAFFTVEGKLLEAVRAIYPWSPGTSAPGSAEQRRRFEQALFARAATQKEPVEGEYFRKSSAVHSLAASTYAISAHETKARRDSGLALVKSLWELFAIVCFFGLGFYFICCLAFRTKETVRGYLLGAATITAFLVFVACAGVGGGGLEDDMLSRFFRSPPRMKEALVVVLDDTTLHRRRPDEVVIWDGSRGIAKDAVRVRQWFPETLLWRPELITDDHGRARIDVPLADSITTWRLSASAVSADGRLGSAQAPLRVFQPFFVDLNLPVALTRGDVVAVPVVVYNYLDRPQTVTLTLADAPGIDRLDEATQRLELPAGDTRAVAFRLRARQVGRHELRVTAQGSGVADAVKRVVEIVPDGQRTEKVTSGTLRQPADIALSVPDDAIEGSVRALVRLYPSSFSQLLEGLEAIFRLPYGCFEQTSSTTYPNVLALDYLRRSGKGLPAVEAKARQYIHLGYQRLLGFEVSGGGFDWFGRPPANRTLTAYGLMEFEDMARVHDVEPALIERTRKWLLDQRRPDGSWDPESHRMHEDPAAGGADLARLRATAYIGWALFRGQKDPAEGRPTLAYLQKHAPASIRDAYTLALVANALLALQPKGPAAAPYLDRLEALKHFSGPNGWWDGGAGRTVFHGAGQSGSIETTALAVLALLAAEREPASVRGALTWLSAQRDGSGAWHSTQATVLALKALLAGTGQPLGAGQERRIQIALDGQPAQDVVIPADQAEVVRQINLSAYVGKGTQRLRLTDRGNTAIGYQVILSYHTPHAGQKKPQGLSIQLAYDRKELKVNETLTATATVANQGATAAPMVMVELPIPAGFTLEGDDLAKLVEAGTIAKLQQAPQKALLYLRALESGRPLTLRYRLRATLAGTIASAPAVAYEYYDPQRRTQSAAAPLLVVADARRP
jgi:uncharacterized protein YfaS (alpha-2-macroglobulin family)